MLLLDLSRVALMQAEEEREGEGGLVRIDMAKHDFAEVSCAGKGGRGVRRKRQKHGT